MTRPISLPLKDWPSADRAMWSALITPGDLLGETGALAHLRATSVAGLVKCYGRWLEWLVRSDPAVLSMPPGERATPARLAAWVTSLAHLAAPTQATLVNGAVYILRAAAPNADWRKQVLQVNALIRAARRASSPRKTGRVLSSSVLLDAGLKLAEQDAHNANTALNTHLMRRDGTMIAFLSVLPIRLRAFSELELGTSVLMTETRISILLSADMMKNARPWEAVVPNALEPLLRRYITEVRPWLLARSDQPHGSLWVGRMGEPLAYRTLSNIIPNVTFRTLGVRVSPHLFRDAMATTVARESPADTRLIRPLLAHSSDAIAERHYNHAKGIEVGRAHMSLIERLSKEHV